MCYCWEEQDPGFDVEGRGGFPQAVDEFEQDVGAD